jgi:hypothetical protein
VAEILHMVSIRATLDKVFAALIEHEGFAGW